MHWHWKIEPKPLVMMIASVMVVQLTLLVIYSALMLMLVIDIRRDVAAMKTDVTTMTRLIDAQMVSTVAELKAMTKAVKTQADAIEMRLPAPSP